MNSDGTKFYFSVANFLVVARGLFPAEMLRRMREEILRRRVETPVLDERARQGLKVGVAPDSVRLDEKWYRIWETVEERRILADFPDYTEIIYPPQIRTVQDRAAFVPWHQDEAYMKALGPLGHKEVITCFLPLNDDPSRCPTLEFVVNPSQASIPHFVRPGVSVNKFDVKDADLPPPSTRRRFPLELGDVFLFGMHVLHRTCFEGELSDRNGRHSVEFRLTTARSTIAGKDYFNLSSKRFYRKG